MKTATTRECNTLMNYLSEYTTGAMRKQLMNNRASHFIVWSIINGGVYHVNANRKRKRAWMFVNTCSPTLVVPTCIQ